MFIANVGATRCSKASGQGCSAAGDPWSQGTSHCRTPRPHGFLRRWSGYWARSSSPATPRSLTRSGSSPLRSSPERSGARSPWCRLPPSLIGGDPNLMVDSTACSPGPYRRSLHSLRAPRRHWRWRRVVRSDGFSDGGRLRDRWTARHTAISVDAISNSREGRSTTRRLALHQAWRFSAAAGQAADAVHPAAASLMERHMAGQHMTAEHAENVHRGRATVYRTVRRQERLMGPKRPH